MARIARNTIETAVPGVLQTYFDQRFDTPTISGYANLVIDPSAATAGVSLFDFSYTPKQIGSTLCIEADSTGRETANTGDILAVAIAKDSDINCFAIGFQGKASDGASLNSAFKALLFTTLTTTSLDPINFHVRVGMSGGNFVLNTLQNTNTAISHSAQGSWVRIVEYAV
jgi:hypothetical protein